MATLERHGNAAAPWVRRGGAGTFQRAARTIPAACRGRQHPGNKPDNAGAVLPRSPAADHATMAKATHHHDAEESAAPPAVSLRVEGIRSRAVSTDPAGPAYQSRSDRSDPLVLWEGIL